MNASAHDFARTSPRRYLQGSFINLFYKSDSLPHAQALEVVTADHFRQGGTETTVILFDTDKERDLEIHSLDATLDLGECWISSHFARDGEEDD